MVRVLFVCLGNICRSPLAEGAFRHLVEEADLATRIAPDSAGTGDWHVGQPPDPRAQATAARRGIDIAKQRARQVAAADFTTFDYMLAMDASNLRTLKQTAPASAPTRLRLFLDYAGDAAASEVPDPYYGGQEGFDQVFDLVHRGAAGLLRHIQAYDL